MRGAQVAVKILAFLQEFPLPPNNGIRADISRRLRCFHALGHEIHVVTWTGGRLDPTLSAENLAEVRAQSASLHVATVDRSWRRALRLPRYPSQIAARLLDKAQVAHILAATYANGSPPDIIWVDGIHASGAALQIASLIPSPIVYRSHNREAYFLTEQAKLSLGLHKLSIQASNLGLARWELALLLKAKFIADISLEDVDFWRNKGIRHNIWLPPLADEKILATAQHSDIARDIDFLYVGGLISPNNVDGLRWFIDYVNPLIRERVPKAKVVVAGRSPSPDLSAILSANGIEVIANPEQVDKLFARARVLFNPIFHGSGVNLKIVDMMGSGRPLVTTNKGARGLPTDLLQMITVTDDPVEFAEYLHRHLQNKLSEVEYILRSEFVGRRLGLDMIKSFILALEAVVRPEIDIN